MAKININYDLGYEEIQLNDNPEDVIYFNGRDLNFYENFRRFCDNARDISKNLDMKDETDFNVIFKNVKEIGDNINKEFDSLFGKDAHKVVFKNINPLTPTVNKNKKVTGLILINFINAITPYIEQCYNQYQDFEKSIREQYTVVLDEIDNANE